MKFGVKSKAYCDSCVNATKTCLVKRIPEIVCEEEEEEEEPEGPPFAILDGDNYIETQTNGFLFMRFDNTGCSNANSCTSGGNTGLRVSLLVVTL